MRCSKSVASTDATCDCAAHLTGVSMRHAKCNAGTRFVFFNFDTEKAQKRSAGIKPTLCPCPALQMVSGSG